MRLRLTQEGVQSTAVDLAEKVHRSGGMGNKSFEPAKYTLHASASPLYPSTRRNERSIRGMVLLLRIRVANGSK